MNAVSIVAIGGLALLFLSYFSGGTCMKDQPNGGALCFPGFDKLGKGAPAASGAPAPTNNCHFAANQVCWTGAGGQGCIKSNPNTSDWKTSSGRNTLCSRARKAYINNYVPAKQYELQSRFKNRAPKSNFAMSYAAERLSIA